MKVPILQDICIFCATRIQFSTARNRVSRQRRLFRSAYAPHRPSEAAAVRQEESPSGDVPRSPPIAAKRTNIDHQSWGRSGPWQGVPRFTAPTSQEPKVIRPDETAPRASSEAQKPQTTIKQPQTSPHFQSGTRVIKLNRYIGDARRDRPPDVQLWKCGCGYHNKDGDRICKNCHAPPPGNLQRSDDPSIARNWRHLRRIGEANEDDPIKEDARLTEPVVDRALEEARLERLEESKHRRFVGLESQFRRQPLDFREIPRRSRQNHEALGGSMSQGARGPTQVFDTADGNGSFSGVRVPRHGVSFQRWRPGPQESTRESNENQAMQRRSDPTDPLRSSTPRYRQVGQEQDKQSPEIRPQESTRESNEYQVRQRRSDPTDSLRSSTPRYSQVGQEQDKQSPGMRPHTRTWKAWSPARTEADLADILPNEAQKDFGAHYEPRPSPRHDEGYVSMMDQQMQSLTSDEAPSIEIPERLKASERRASESRMARRLQALEEESESSLKRPAPARYDSHRERRTSIVRTRKFLESRDDDFEVEEDSDRMRRQRKKERKKQQAAEKLQGPPTPIYLPEFISIANLAGALRIRIEDFARKMKDLGFAETNNDYVLDSETAGLIAAEFNFEPIVDQREDEDLLPRPPAEDKSLLPPRPPVVTIMGHVDHGKTTLLDWLRKSSVAASEYGGITQHIGAFSVSMPSGGVITFLDTPGHAAFLDMRQRGANVTDIVILVVAADDSVKPQTIEAIKHAQAAKVPMIVAVNKIDKEDANVDKVKQDLARYGVNIEDYGGDTQVVCVSGKTGQGMETLEESAVALADILDMRAETDGQAEGWVLEATTKKAGRVATVLVRRGTLHPGDIIVAGTTWARIRSLRNEAGIEVGNAGPGTPVEIDGWKDQPAAGDEVLQADDEQHARSVVDIRLQADERARMATDMSAVNEARRLEQERREAAEAADAEAAGRVGAVASVSKHTPVGFKEVPLLVKADVSGSVEAVLASVLALGNTSVRASILRSGVGTVTEFDVSHAASAQGYIVAFNIAIEPSIRRAAEASGVKILEQNVIYRLVDLIRGVLEDYLEPIRSKRVLGEAEVAQVFEINIKRRQVMPVAGCRIRNGVVARNARVMVRRGGEEVFDGPLSSLKNRKQDAMEMRKGSECGMGFEGWTDFRVGDQIQSYEEKIEKRTL